MDTGVILYVTGCLFTFFFMIYGEVTQDKQLSVGGLLIALLAALFSWSVIFVHIVFFVIPKFSELVLWKGKRD